MLQPLPSLSVIRSFEAAARHESFTHAAEELGVTQGAVNRQVRELERMLGTSLFRREGRTVRLTDAGKRLARDLAADLHSLGRTIERALASGSQQSHISLGVPPTFGARWLVPRLPAFLERHPEISVSVRSFSEPFDLRAERIDLAIHFGLADWPGSQIRTLCPENVVAVVAPSLIQKLALTSPRDLSRAPRLWLASRPNQWEDFRETHDLPATPDSGGILFDQFTMIIAAATAGLGAGLIPSYLIEQELSSGALVQMGKLSSPSGAHYHIVTPSGMASRPLRKMSDWLSRQMSRSKAPLAARS